MHVMDISSAYPDTYRVLLRSRIKLLCPQVLQHEFIMLNSYQAIKVYGEMHVNIHIIILKTASCDRVGPPLGRSPLIPCKVKG